MFMYTYKEDLVTTLIFHVYTKTNLNKQFWREVRIIKAGLNWTQGCFLCLSHTITSAYNTSHSTPWLTVVSIIPIKKKDFIWQIY